MKSYTNAQFRKLYAALPAEIRRQAREAYKLFLKDPYYPSLHFKRVHTQKPIYSARITDNYRALGVRDADEIVWFWIGTHAEYDRLLARI